MEKIEIVVSRNYPRWIITQRFAVTANSGTSRKICPGAPATPEMSIESLE